VPCRRSILPDEGSATTLHTVVRGVGVLTTREIEIVRSDWERVELIADQAADLLYKRLFALDKRLRLLFPLRSRGAEANGDPDAGRGHLRPV
jgi:hypothetical protein